MNLTVFLLLLMFCAGCNTAPVTLPLPASESGAKIIYFSETGHTLNPPFSTYFNQHNGLERLGLPITEVVESNGWQVQYFQYGRLEIHPENQPAYYVTVGWLGSLENRTRPPLAEPPCSNCRFYPQTGHTVSGDFLRHFDANGNTVQFGLPLSEPFMHNGLLTQDFQSARLIWRPDLPASDQVQLEPLGETYFLNNHLPLNWLNPVLPPTDAKTYTTQSIPLPPHTTTRFRIEETTTPNIVRVTATFFADGLPVKDYAPYFSREENVVALPPTRSNGQTHLLVFCDDCRMATFTLFDHTQTVTLNSAVYK